MGDREIPYVTIPRWKQASLPPLFYNFAKMKPAPYILSFDPSSRIQEQCKEQGVSFHTINSRYQVPTRDKVNIFMVGGNLEKNIGVAASHRDAIRSISDPDKMHMIREVCSVAQRETTITYALFEDREVRKEMREFTREPSYDLFPRGYRTLLKRAMNCAYDVCWPWYRQFDIS